MREKKKNVLNLQSCGKKKEYVKNTFAREKKVELIKKEEKKRMVLDEFLRSVSLVFVGL